MYVVNSQSGHGVITRAKIVAGTSILEQKNILHTLRRPQSLNLAGHLQSSKIPLTLNVYETTVKLFKPQYLGCVLLSNFGGILTSF